MLFNSVDFLIFFSIFFFLFYFFSGINRKILLLIGSSLFYMWFIPAYILILFLIIAIDYYAAKKIEDTHSKKAKKRLLIWAIVNTCLVLFIFKYNNFFIDNFNALGFHQVKHWHIILPIGLSFHTFQSLSYVIEVYRGNFKAERNLLTYSNFVMMFPQLVAGPIERANNLLPQLKKCDHIITSKDLSIGMLQFFWGLFKKAVVADTLSSFVNAAYGMYQFQPGSVLLAGTILFAIQIYCDFSGYSDMAIGIARMLGFKFRDNFKLPYFSKDITEFWRRWHISLSTWLRDYIYIPFGGSKRSKWRTHVNLLLTMLIGGFWHGASWNFIIWGGFNGLYLSFERLIKIHQLRPRNIVTKSIRILYTFTLISFSWIFFRSETFAQSVTILKKIGLDFSLQKFWFWDLSIYPSIIVGLSILFGFEYFILRKQTFDQLYEKKNRKIVFCSLTVFFILVTILSGNSNGSQFIYFQF
ncbi:MAG TPA: MBOAT family O-acyltransferase [Ferruginibacter sp.]|nr:MBOAT family O-acyltransferase [Ferruginibacter sp.]